MRFFPSWGTRVFAARARAYIQQHARASGCCDLNDKLLAQYGSRILRGPFQGLELTPMTRREHLAPYLLGIYERELHPAFETIFEKRFSKILDVGAKFGFYAAGLGRHFPTAEVTAFDPDPWAQKATKEMCERNQIGNVAIRSLCDSAWLASRLSPNAFILSDCEGYEATLFTSVAIPALASATMIIEVHEQFSPGVTARLRSAFAGTHQITEIPVEAAPLFHPPELTTLSAQERALALNEFRTDQQSWLFLVPIS